MSDVGASSGLGRFLTIADVAETLNISVSSAYTLVRSGELAAIRIGTRGEWRVENTMLQAFIDSKYEEARRHNLWNQVDFSDVAEFSTTRTPRE